MSRPRRRTRRSAAEGRPSSTGDDQDQWFSHALVRGLLHAYYWVDDSLQNYMRAHADISLPRAQSMLMVCIGDGIHRQSEMARVLRVSKQAVQQGIRELIDKGLVEIVPDAANKRSKIVRFTDQGQGMREIAGRGMGEIEKELAQRIGEDRVWLLHQILELQWGAPPEFRRGE